MRRWASVTPAMLAAALLTVPLAWSPLAYADGDDSPAQGPAGASAAPTAPASDAPVAGDTGQRQEQPAADQGAPSPQAPTPASEDNGGEATIVPADPQAKANEGDNDSPATPDETKLDGSAPTPRLGADSEDSEGNYRPNWNAKAAAYNGAPPNCNVHSVYAIGAGGIMYELTSGSNYWRELPYSSLAVESGQGDLQVNGLGVGKDKAGNSVWYAYQRQTVQHGSGRDRTYQARVHIYRSVNGQPWQYVNKTDVGPKLPSQKYVVPNGGWNYLNQMPVGGAVNPVDGSYWILVYERDDIQPWNEQIHNIYPPRYAGTGSTHARLYRVDPDTGQVRAKGSAFIPKFGHGSDNGDLYFDAQGNAVLVQTLGGVDFLKPPTVEALDEGLTKIHRISAGQLEAAGPNTKLHAWSSPKLYIRGLNQNTGVAYEFPTGRMVISDLDSSLSFNPSDYSDSTRAASGLSESMDLASCSYPHTLEVLKNVEGREDPNHQFRLKVERPAGTDPLIDEVVTEGNDDGLQNQQIGPISVGEGVDLVIYEELEGAKAGQSLADYDPTMTCTESTYQGTSYQVEVKTTPATDRSGQVIPGRFHAKIPMTPKAAVRPMQIKCIITNSPEPDPSIVKVIKKVRPYQGAADGSQDTVLGDWNFTIDPAQGELGIDNYATQATEAADGATSWELKPNGAISLTEELTQGGKTYGFAQGSCVDGQGANVPAQFVENAGTVKVGNLTVAEESELTCTFVNQELPTEGSVRFSKVDTEGNVLHGSVWTLTGTDPVVAGREVEDCVADQAAQCQGPDKDPAAGEFLIEKIKLGSYQLVEKSAPAGYQLSDDVHAFTLTTDAPDYEFTESFVNERKPPVNLPITGGTGTYVFTLGGIFALILAAGAALKAVR